MVPLDVLSCRVPGRRASLAQQPHTDGAGVDDPDLAVLEELEDVQQGLVHQGAPAVGEDGVDGVRGQQGDQPLEGLQAVAGQPDISHLPLRLELEQCWQGELDYLLQAGTELHVMHLRWSLSCEYFPLVPAVTWIKSM